MGKHKLDGRSKPRFKPGYSVILDTDKCGRIHSFMNHTFSYRCTILKSQRKIKYRTLSPNTITESDTYMLYTLRIDEIISSLLSNSLHAPSLNIIQKNSYGIREEYLELDFNINSILDNLKKLEKKWN